ncbi:hypothetical protein [Enterococcus larvae]|uniref:hypothetical protein n=1 Tax=Enterococcus larvae TaxID=2794352 RepID=UPI003F322C72
MKNKKVLIGIIILVVAVAGGVGGYFAYQSYQADQQAKQEAKKLADQLNKKVSEVELAMDETYIHLPDSDREDYLQLLKDAKDVEEVEALEQEIAETDEANTFYDKEIINAVKVGIEARWKLVNADGTVTDLNDEKEQERYLKYIKAEIEPLTEYLDKQTKKPELAEAFTTYYDAVKQQLDATEEYKLNSNSWKNQYNNGANQREKSIAEFVQKYDLTLDEEYEDDLTEFILRYLPDSSNRELFKEMTADIYQQQAREGDKNKGDKLIVTGKVVQSVEATNGGSALVRVATAAGEYNNWNDDVFYVVIPGDIWGEKRLLEGDMVTLYVVTTGLYSFENTGGSTTTEPSGACYTYDLN